MGNIKNNEKADKSFISKTVLICSLWKRLLDAGKTVLAKNCWFYEVFNIFEWIDN